MPQGDNIDSVAAKIPSLYTERMDRQYLQERGRFGSIYVDNTNPIAFPDCGVCEIFAASALVIDTLKGSLKGGKVESGGESLPVPAGTSIKGLFLSMKLTSGKAICYLAGPIDTLYSTEEGL